MFEHSTSSQNKISPEFAARLAQLESKEKVRVIVLLQVKDVETHGGKRQSRAERQANMKALRKSAEYSLDEIEKIIKRFDGHPLVKEPNLLGSIPIEITSTGVDALSKSDAVKAVIEDQAIYSEDSIDSPKLQLR
ncbi:MAG: hypothetical protein AAFN40_05045 [Cyanobacteria bacterium J06560_6]